jgi:DNA-binding ferritin-like protein (Dps family)
VESVYGPDALKLIPGEDVANYIDDTLRDSESYWDAVLKTRERLAKHHSFDVRFRN